MSVSAYERRRETVVSWGRTLLNRLSAIERELWIVVVVAMLGDLWLTQQGLQRGFYEGNPLMRSLLAQYGTAALPASKLAALAVAGITRELVPERTTPVVPLGLSLPWVVAVVVNGVLLFGG